MTSILNANHLSFVNSVDTLQTSLSKVENELSSGLAVTSASDAPDQVSAILQLHANIQQNQQVQNNLNVEKTQAQTADQSLTTAGTMLDQIATLAAEGVGTNQTASTRQQLASQVTSLLKQMVSIANTNVNGQYIFSGDSDQTPTYTFDSNSGTAQRLQVVTATKSIQDGSGGAISVNQSANTIFDARDATDAPVAGKNVFTAISNVISALNANDTTKLQTSVNDVQTSSSYLSTQQQFYGNVETQVNSALTNASNLSVQYQSDLSNRQDVDATSAILELQQYTTTLQAAMAAQAKMPQTTLFDVLQP